MRTLIVQAITAFYASATVSDAFVTCTSFTLKATPSRGSIMASNSKSDLATTMVTQRTGATTRRYFLESTATAAAGVLGCSLLLPAPTFAAAKVDREVFTTKGGVKFIVLKEGSGPIARDGDFCIVEFTGFLPNGDVFDASNAPGRKPIAFKLGASQVIPGWEEVLRLMNAGAEVQMVVPSAMAFREKGICLENGDCLVKPGQDVRYDLKLMRVAVSP